MFDFFRKKKKEEEKAENLSKDTYNEDNNQDTIENLYNDNEDNESLLEDNNINNSETNKQFTDGKVDKITFESRDLGKNYKENIENNLDSETNDSNYFDENISNQNDDLSDEIVIDGSEENLDENIEIEVDKPEKIGFFDRIKEGLIKTRDQFSSQIKNLFTANVKIDDDLYEELEEILISSDIGMDSTLDIVDKLKSEIKTRKIKESDQIYPLLREIMVEKLNENNLDNELNIEDNQLAIILVIGVNGVGKTTTIGKLAHNLKNEGKTVMLAAADTFRAAAIEQLGEWADKADVEMIALSEGADPSAVIFDAIQSAKSNNIDVLICDTAGRLHNKKNLMKELEKINKTIDTHAGKASRENILVLDATTGQNAVSQLREFKNVTDITGLVLTKLDGTAKGGIIFPLQVELNVPVKYIGLGEGIDNLEKFDSNSFVEAMF